MSEGCILNQASPFSRARGLFEQVSLCGFRGTGGGGFNAGPTSDEFVVGAGVFGLAEALAYPNRLGST